MDIPPTNQEVDDITVISSLPYDNSRAASLTCVRFRTKLSASFHLCTCPSGLVQLSQTKLSTQILDDITSSCWPGSVCIDKIALYQYARVLFSSYLGMVVCTVTNGHYNLLETRNRSTPTRNFGPNTDHSHVTK